ncbi:MAG: hydantoinase B/oxoprolinase family protein, partial [Gammaproteobacteria bacterium]
LTERRLLAPWGLQGGKNGKLGSNHLNGQPLAGKISCEVAPGDILRVETPGGGGWGEPVAELT